MLEVIFLDDKGTPDDPGDDDVHVVELEECISRRDIPNIQSLFTDMLMEELAEIDTGEPITQNSAPLAVIINDIMARIIATRAILDIEYRPEDRDVLVELRCGHYRAHVIINLETALDFFNIKEGDFDDDIPGDKESPITTVLNVDAELSDIDTERPDRRT